MRARVPLELLVAAAASAAAAAALGGCGERVEHVEQLRTLRMSPAAYVSKAPARRSVAAGAPNAGRLVDGLQLPDRGPYWLTWDPIRHTVPNRPGRRWGTDRLLAYLLTVLRDYRLHHPGLPPLLVGDLSRPDGGPFGSGYGGLGHASHQNGLDVDVYYPRLDRAARAPARVADVDRALAQDLVNRFVAFGAQRAFVGLRLGLRGPPSVVQAIEHHDDHVHVRIAGAPR